MYVLKLISTRFGYHDKGNQRSKLHTFTLEHEIKAKINDFIFNLEFLIFIAPIFR